jgi:aminoglycoside phosphotransferase (APT) family kinase protein
MLIDSFPIPDSWTAVEQVIAGWSHEEEKYHVTTAEGDELLLRLAGGERDRYNRLIFEVLGQLDPTAFRFPQPVAQDSFDGGRASYLLLEWLPGQELELQLPRLPWEEQYRLGLRSGTILKALHTSKLTNKPRDPDWAKRYLMMRDHKMQLYLSGDVRLEDEDVFLDFVKRNRALVEGRPQTIRHGDFHAGNLLLDDAGEIEVIDFSRLAFGDPWLDFVRLSFDAHTSPAFASGRIDSYFPEGAPVEFFSLLAFYLAHNSIGSIPFALQFGEAEVEFSINQAQMVREWYDGFTTVFPHWYVKGEKQSKCETGLTDESTVGGN